MTRATLTQEPNTCFILQLEYSQPAFTCSKLTIETLEQGVKYIQS